MNCRPGTAATIQEQSLLKSWAVVQKRTDVSYLASGKSKPCHQGSEWLRCREQIRYR